MSKFTPRERLELVKNEDYWDKARVPKVDKMVLLPMPEANARTAALLSGQVDWVEAPAPDAVKEIKQRGFTHYSPMKSRMSGRGSSRAIEGSPWNDIRVRKAANLCVDREGLKDGLLAGLMVPATGTFEPGHPWRGNPTFQIKYDLKAAQKLMQEAGYGPSKKLTVKTQTSASGSGQMLPLPMNEYLQQALAECYFDVQLDVIEWNTLFTNWRRGAKDPTANGANATNVTYAAMDPFFALVRFLQSSMAPPVSNNWGYINNPKFDELVTKARQTFDPAARDAALAELHAASVDDAAFLYVAHDVAPRAMSPKVKGFVQPKSWFVDFSPVSHGAVRETLRLARFPSPLVGEGGSNERSSFETGEGFSPRICVPHLKDLRPRTETPHPARMNARHLLPQGEKGRRKSDSCLPTSPDASSM